MIVPDLRTVPTDRDCCRMQHTQTETPSSHAIVIQPYPSIAATFVVGADRLIGISVRYGDWSTVIVEYDSSWASMEFGGRMGISMGAVQASATNSFTKARLHIQQRIPGDNRVNIRHTSHASASAAPPWSEAETSRESASRASSFQRFVVICSTSLP
jgi:hypothetical protein